MRRIHHSFRHPARLHARARPLAGLTLLLAVSIAAAACAARHASPASSPLAPASETIPPAGGPRAAAGVRYKGTIASDGRDARVRVDLYAAAPDRVRAEIATPLGQPLASIVMRGDDMTILWHRERAFWQGSATGPVQAGLPGGGRAWAAALLGDVESLSAIEGAVVTRSGEATVVTLPVEGAPAVRLEFPQAAGAPPRTIDSNPSPELAIHLIRAAALQPPDAEGGFALGAPEGYARWSEFDLPAMIGVSG